MLRAGCDLEFAEIFASNYAADKQDLEIIDMGNYVELNPLNSHGEAVAEALVAYGKPANNEEKA